MNSFIRYKRKGLKKRPKKEREEGYVETSSDWEMAWVRWVFGERGERERMVRKVWTRDERELWDYRPVCMRLNVERGE